jgi:Leucine-rich repeat (LRR) protein
MAAVGAMTLLALLWFSASLLFRRRFQFNIRSLLLMVVVVALACGWLAVEMKEAKRQREAAAAIEKSRGLVGQSGGSPAWLRTLLGDYFFESIRAVVFFDRYHPVTDAQLHDLQDTLAGLNQLQELGFYDTKITDAGLDNLQGLNQLQKLGFYGTQITDAGLVRLKGMNTLKWLDLRKTAITDAGLENLKGLNQLEWLYLQGTKVTDDGVKKLQQALPNCKITR